MPCLKLYRDTGWKDKQNREVYAALMNPIEPSARKLPTLNPKLISWYRTPVDRKMLKELHVRSDVLGFAQSLGYLGLLVLSGTAAYIALQSNWKVGLLVVFIHGTFGAFIVNGIHELCHETVFKTPFWNRFFLRIFSFIAWFNYEIFTQSHSRHHRYTLHPPEDEEGQGTLTLIEWLKAGFIRPVDFFKVLAKASRVARGQFIGSWENVLFPPDDPAKRREPIIWARTLLIGHGSILVVSIYFQMWWLPLITSVVPFYGKWLFRLCNDTQHQGLPDHSTDFRICCRTFTINPIIQFLYWHMNFHIEHHMYPGVPCYRLKKLHQLVKHDLPACPHGLIETWREIAELKKGKRSPIQVKEELVLE
jgi:fatty acid desaturase